MLFVPIILLTIFLHSAFAGLAMSRNRIQRPIIMKEFNLNAYLGRWYEIATTPAARLTFQRGCQCTMTDYGLLENSTSISVTNTCLRDSGVTVAKGIATQTDPEDATKLYVEFDGQPRCCPIGRPKPNYTIAFVSDCYEYAVVLGPTGFTWILSRFERIASEEVYEELVGFARERGGVVAVAQLKKTVQDDVVCKGVRQVNP